MSYHVIVGGGLAGLFVAKRLLNKGTKKIIIIEKNKNLGGLLKSEYIDNPDDKGRKLSFDFGTHFVLSPKNTLIDNLILEDINPNDYYKFDKSLMEGHVINEKLYSKSGCPNANNFSILDKKEIENELKTLNEKYFSQESDLNKISDPKNNLQEYFLFRYGHKATELIYKPFYEKLTGLNCEHLNVSLKDSFVPGRLILFDRETSKKIKKNPQWDWRIAFSDCRDGESNINKYYPKNGGIYKWIIDIRDVLIKNGVKIYLNSEIKKLNISEKQIKNISLASGEKLGCKKIYWTIPVFNFFKLANLKFESATPLLKKVTVVHFLIDKKPINRPFWIIFYDKKFISYRATLYDNFAPNKSKYSRISVELFQDLSDKIPDLETKIFNELVITKIIPEDSKKVWSMISENSTVIPINKSNNRSPSNQFNLIEKKFDNLILLANRPDEKKGQIEALEKIMKLI